MHVLNQGDVRIRGERGFPLKGIVERKSEHPRSYLVKTSYGTYRRNRRHLLKVEEPIKGSEIENMNYDGVYPKEGNGDINPGEPNVKEPSTAKEQVQSSRQIVSRQNNDTENVNLNVHTRSGR